MSDIGSRIRSLRTASKLSQRDLAERLQVTHTTIGNWENGNHQPDIEEVVKICDLFKVSVDWLVGRRGGGDFKLADCLSYLDEERTLSALAMVGTRANQRILELAS